MFKGKINSKSLTILSLLGIIFFSQFAQVERNKNIKSLSNHIYNLEHMSIDFYKENKSFDVSDDYLTSLKNIKVLSNKESNRLRKHKRYKKNRLFKIYGYKDKEQVLLINAINTKNIRKEIHSMNLEDYQFVLEYKNIYFVLEDFY